MHLRMYVYVLMYAPACTYVSMYICLYAPVLTYVVLNLLCMCVCGHAVIIHTCTVGVHNVVMFAVQ